MLSLPQPHLLGKPSLGFMYLGLDTYPYESVAAPMLGGLRGHSVLFQHEWLEWGLSPFPSASVGLT